MTQKEFNKNIKSEIVACKPKAEIDFFDFIQDTKLRLKILKSYKEAVFVKNLCNILPINFGDAHPLNEIQILHFASIYEAIIDYVLEKYYPNDVKILLKERIMFKEADVCKSVEIKKDSGKLYLCRMITTDKKLYKVKFEDRVKKSIELGIVDSQIKVELTQLYNYRNHIHIIKAAKNKHNFTKKLASAFCDENSLKSFCNKMKDSIPNSE